MLLPEGAEDFDEETAAATGGVGHADFSELRHEKVGAFEIAFLTAYGVADFVHELSGERVDQRVGHWAGDSSRRVVDALVFAVGGKEHFIALAKDVLIYAAVIVLYNAAAGSLIQGVAAKK